MSYVQNWSKSSRWTFLNFNTESYQNWKIVFLLSGEMTLHFRLCFDRIHTSQLERSKKYMWQLSSFEKKMTSQSLNQTKNGTWRQNAWGGWGWKVHVALFWCRYKQISLLSINYNIVIDEKDERFLSTCLKFSKSWCQK